MKDLLLRPEPMTPQLMKSLEDDGLIIRLAPNRHLLDLEAGDAKGVPVYKSSADYGPHMLLAVTINQPGLARFGHHPDNEEFLLIGDPEAEPLLLAIFKGKVPELEQKVRDGVLSERDFVCFEVKMNDAEVSFFTMLAGVPHGECVRQASDHPASFYVTEPANLPLCKTDFGGYRLLIG